MSDLTPTEQTNVRTAIRFLKARCGTWDTLAKLLRFKAGTLGHVAGGRKPVTPTLALRIARFAKVGVDDVLAGRFPEPGTCAHCGHRAEAAE